MGLHKKNLTIEDEIQKLEKKKLMNEASDKLTFMLGMTPQVDHADKVLKYERSLQKRSKIKKIVLIFLC